MSSAIRRLMLTLACTTLLGSAADVALAAPAAERTGSPDRSTEQRGARIASTALEYVGYPYRWGGASPASGFDCSGFVVFVYETVGVRLPHDQAGQLASGRRIDPDELQPGDVLIFQNTYRAGLSHSGIYVGNGAFVHAADERQGVTLTPLWSGYWGERLYAAVRP